LWVLAFGKDVVVEGISSSVWFPVVTLVIGVFLKAFFDSLTEKRRARFDSESRIEKRKEMILMQRIDLQRKALGDIQNAVSEVVRSAVVKHLARCKMHQETGAWGEGGLSDDVRERSRTAFLQATQAKVRVRDEHVRGMVEKLSKLCTQASFAISKSASEEAVHAAGSLFNEFNEKVGEALRALEDDEQALLI
jgi:Arc/MetJ-type ribon-helix-helix transcriptional regulator